MNIRKLSVALLALLSLCGAGVARADDDDDKRENIPVRDSNGAPLDFRLIQVTAFNPTIAPAATDLLAPDTKNHISVLNNRSVEIEFHPVVTPAVSPLTYRVWFCRFGSFINPETAGSGCVALLDPASTATPKGPLSLTVDAAGAAKGTGLFPPLAANAPAGSDLWAGSFVVTRGIGTPTVTTVEFVSAFAFPAAPEGPKRPAQEEDGAEVQVKGEIAGLDVAKKSFLLAGAASFPVVIDDSTRFIGRHKSFEDLSDGMEVDIHGTFAKDATTNTLFILADRIRAGRED